MTQSQEGHVCLRWALCNKTWTHIKKNTAHLPILSLFFFQGYHVRKFLSRFWVQQDCGEISLALESRGIVYLCHVSFTQLQLKNSFENYLAIENLSLLAVFCLFFCSAWKLWDCRDLGRDDKNKREDKGNRVYKIWRTKSRAEKKKFCILT